MRIIFLRLPDLYSDGKSPFFHRARVDMRAFKRKKNRPGSARLRRVSLCNRRGCRVNVHLSQLAGPRARLVTYASCMRVCVCSVRAHVRVLVYVCMYVCMRPSSASQPGAPRAAAPIRCATLATRLLCRWLERRNERTNERANDVRGR